MALKFIELNKLKSIEITLFKINVNPHLINTNQMVQNLALNKNLEVYFWFNNYKRFIA